MNAINTASEHPSQEELAAFALGKPTANPDTIAEHVAACAHCETVVAQTPRDTFLGILNKGKPGASLTGAYKGNPHQSFASIGGSLAAVPVNEDELPAELKAQGKYKFLRKLGGGGMGVVYLAEHIVMQRRVAIKLIPPAMSGNSEVVGRFIQEIVTAAKLEHQNVVRAYSTEQVGGHILLEMEYVDGKDLNDVVVKKGPLPIANAVSYTRHAATGLQQAFLQNMVHRDIKPRNLMLTRTGNVKIADFGLAKFSQEKGRPNDGKSLTGANAVMGTPDYMAPEQARSAKTVDIRADIYSLGCTLYFLLTGEAPYKGDTPIDIIFAHVEQPVPDVRALRPDVSEELAAFLKRMMAKSPEERPGTPKEVIDGLARVAKGYAQPKEIYYEKAIPVKAPDAELPFADFTPTRPPIRKRADRSLWFALAAPVLLLLAGGIVFEMKTREGTIVVETDLPNPRITVNGNESLTIDREDGGKKIVIHLKRGEVYKVVVEMDGFEATGETVTLKDREKTIKATWVRKKSDVPVSPKKEPAITRVENTKLDPVITESKSGDVVHNPPSVFSDAAKPDPKVADDAPATTKEVPQFVPASKAIFDGNSLKNWIKEGNSTSVFEIEGNKLVGRGAAPGGFLYYSPTRDQAVADFALKVRGMAKNNGAGIIFRAEPSQGVMRGYYVPIVSHRFSQVMQRDVFAGNLHSFAPGIANFLAESKVKDAANDREIELEIRCVGTRIETRIDGKEGDFSLDATPI